MTLLVSYSVPEDAITKLRQQVFQILKPKVPGLEEISYPPHISIATALHDKDLSKLRDFLPELKPFKPVFRGTRLGFLKGREDLDYVAVTLSVPPQFQKAHEMVRDLLGDQIVKFGEGHKPHISLVRAPRGPLTPELLEQVNKTVPVHVQLKAEKVQLWGPDKQIVKEASMTQKPPQFDPNQATAADQQALEEYFFQHTTPTASISLDDRLTILAAKDVQSHKKLSMLVETLMEQSRHNKPDTLSKITATIQELERTFLKRVPTQK